MQSLRNIQGTKDAGYEWYQLLVRIFVELGWKPNSTCRGVWVYIKDDVTAYINMATDDILYMSRSMGPLDKLLNRFGDFFSFIVKRGTELQFLSSLSMMSFERLCNEPPTGTILPFNELF